MEALPFNRPHATGREFEYIKEAIANLHISGNGPFTRRCTEWLERRTGCAKALMTGSGTGALELSCLLIGLEPGDEVVMPSFTFVSTANAVALRGGVPVFVDIRADTLNLDEGAIEAALSNRTRAILPVHYAGVSCAMAEIGAIAERANLSVIEDAAQGVMSAYRGQALGSIGDLGCLSFHETKNVTCGEGGALLVNDPALIERAEIIQEKGTDRSRFFRGEVDRYTWVEPGSSFLASDINAAFLWAQLERAEEITRARLGVWQSYHERLGALEEAGRLRRPLAPAGCDHNAHMYYLLVEGRRQRDALIDHLSRQGVQAVFHFVPLHSSPAGRRLGRSPSPLPVTDETADRLLRLPLWLGMGEAEVERVVGAVAEVL